MFDYTPDTVAWLLLHRADETCDLDLIDYNADLDAALAELAKCYPGAARVAQLLVLGYDEVALGERLEMPPKQVRSVVNLVCEELARLMNT